MKTCRDCCHHSCLVSGSHICHNESLLLEMTNGNAWLWFNKIVQGFELTEVGLRIAEICKYFKPKVTV